MVVKHSEYTLATYGKGLTEITDRVAEAVRVSGVLNGVVTVFVRHTSASLVIMENADPTACRDLEAYFDHLVPEDIPYFQHTYEGADDMPSHVRMALTRSSEAIPVIDGKMELGTWQGIFLFEHRRDPHTRKMVMTVMGE